MEKYNGAVFITDLHLSSTIPVSRIDDYIDTAFRKVETVLQICKERNAVLLIGGDMFNTPTQPDFIKNRLIELLERYRVHTYSIPGNHDLLYYSLEYFDRTSFRVIRTEYFHCLLDYKSNSVKLGDWLIIGHEFDKPFPVHTGDERSIVLSHAFFKREDRLTVSEDEVKNSGVDYVCMGHDHNLYEPRQVGSTLVLRPGAMTRGTSNTESRMRMPSFAYIDFSTGEYSYEEIPGCLPFDEVFRENYDVKQEQEVLSFDEISDFIQSLKSMKSELNPYDLLDAIEGVPDKIRNRCEQYLSTSGLKR